MARPVHHPTPEEIENEIRRRLMNLEEKNEVVRGLNRLSDENRLDVVMEQCEKLTNSSELCEYLQEQLTLTLNAETTFQDPIDLQDTAFYFVMKYGEPEKRVQSIIYSLHRSFVNHNYNAMGQLGGNEFCYEKFDLEKFSQFRKQLDNKKTVLQYIIYEHSQLLLNLNSEHPMRRIVEHLPSDENLYHIITNIKDENGHPWMFYTCKELVEKLYTDHVGYHRHIAAISLLSLGIWKRRTTSHFFWLSLHSYAWFLSFSDRACKSERYEEFYKLLSLQDSNGQTVLHAYPSLYCFLYRIYKPEQYEQLYKLLSIQDNNGQTALHNYQSFHSLLNRIYKPEHHEELYKLLLIQDNNGQTALHDCRAFRSFLDQMHKPERYEELYKLLLVEDKWGSTVLYDYQSFHSLLDRIYKPEHHEELYRLLSIQDNKGRTVLHVHKPFHSLLDRIYKPECYEELYKLLSMQDNNGQTLLHDHQSFHYLLDRMYKLERYEELYKLLSIQDNNGQTALHVHQSFHSSLSRIYKHERYEELFKLLSIQDNNGQTVLHVHQSFHSFLDSVCKLERYEELYKLLSIQDNNGETVLHVKTEDITKLLTKLYKPCWRQSFLYLVSITNNEKRTASEASNSPNLSSLIQKVESNQYVSSCYWNTNILIMYNTKGRPEAEVEAKTIFDALRSKYFGYNITLEKEKTSEETINLIKETAIKTPGILLGHYSALFVILASHGHVGTISDCDGNPIKLSDIEDAMCMEAVEGKPKILITQCCQDGKESATLPPYSPRHDDFCAVMSCVSGQPSERGVFLDKLAECIKNNRKNENIYKLVNAIETKMVREGHSQTPIIMSTLKAEFLPTVEWDRKTGAANIALDEEEFEWVSSSDDDEIIFA